MDDEYKKGYGRGPGCTTWKVGEDGRVQRAKWNDPAWANLESHTPYMEMRPWEIELMLRNAYVAGKNDKAEQLRQVMEIKER